MERTTTQDFLKLGGKLTHVREEKRVITIAFFCVGTDIYYGASVFTRDDTEKVFTKKTRQDNNQQAVDRLLNTAVTVTDPVSHEWWCTGPRRGAQVQVRRMYLREQLRVKGVKDETKPSIDVLQHMADAAAARITAKAKLAE